MSFKRNHRYNATVEELNSKTFRHTRSLEGFKGFNYFFFLFFFYRRREKNWIDSSDRSNLFLSFFDER